LPTAPRETREAFVPIRTIAALRSLRCDRRPGPSAKVGNNLTECWPFGDHATRARGYLYSERRSQGSHGRQTL